MIENVSTQLTVFHCFAHCLLPGRAFASLYALLFLEKEAEIGGRDIARCQISSVTRILNVFRGFQVNNVNPLNAIKMHLKCHKLKLSDALYLLTLTNGI